MNFVTIAILALIGLGLVAALFGLFSKSGSSGSASCATSSGCAGCSGDDPRCEQERMMEAACKPVEYYDDEELDAFRGRPSAGYTDEEADQFADVLTTLQPDEVKSWGRSLTLRGIEMPDQIKDEYFALIES